MHTKIFATLAVICATPSVSLLSVMAVNPDFPIEYHTGLLFTWSALACSALVFVTAVSATADLFGSWYEGRDSNE